MRKTTLAVATALALALTIRMEAVGAEPGGLDRLKALAGEWEGKNTAGEAARVTYEVSANGTAVVETLSVGPMHTMVTVYHSDGDGLMLTHYCGVGNQPRMRAEKTHAPEMMLFSFADATNLASPADGHMHNLKLTFADKDHLRQTWTWREKGQEKEEVIELARRR
jgi:predicted metal-binding membrane protein